MKKIKWIFIVIWLSFIPTYLLHNIRIMLYRVWTFEISVKMCSFILTLLLHPNQLALLITIKTIFKYCTYFALFIAYHSHNCYQHFFLYVSINTSSIFRICLLIHTITQSLYKKEYNHFKKIYGQNIALLSVVPLSLIAK